jgi:hypothetical protein
MEVLPSNVALIDPTSSPPWKTQELASWKVISTNYSNFSVRSPNQKILIGEEWA